MKIAIYQPNIVWEDQDANCRKLEQALQRADLNGVTLLCLPELFSIGFTMNTNLAESKTGKTVTFLRKLAKQYKLFVLGTFLEKDTRKAAKQQPKNTALLISPEGMLNAMYAKVHLFSFDGEDNYFQPGTSLGLFSMDNVPLGVVICYDLRFPELFRAMMGKKQEQRPSLFIVPANWPAVRIHHWRTLLQARAIENQAFIIGINRTGNSPKAAYCGNSLVIDPLGNLVLDAGEKEGLFIADINLDTVGEVRGKFPFLDDRKVKWYKKQW